MYTKLKKTNMFHFEIFYGQISCSPTTKPKTMFYFPRILLFVCYRCNSIFWVVNNDVFIFTARLYFMYTFKYSRCFVFTIDKVELIFLFAFRIIRPGKINDHRAIMTSFFSLTVYILIAINSYIHTSACTLNYTWLVVTSISVLFSTNYMYFRLRINLSKPSGLNYAPSKFKT